MIFTLHAYFMLISCYCTKPHNYYAITDTYGLVVSSLSDIIDPSSFTGTSSKSKILFNDFKMFVNDGLFIESSLHMVSISAYLHRETYVEIILCTA